MTNDATVADLMDKIGRAMGNTSIYQAVDVSLSAMGHIEVKDVKSGRMLTDLHIVASDVQTDDISTLGEITNAHIFSFNQSGYAYARTQDSIATAHDFYDQRVFAFNTTLRRQDSEALASKLDTVQSVMGENVDVINFSVNGTAFNVPINVLTTMENLFGEIKATLDNELSGNFDVGLHNGKLVIFDNNASGPSIPDELKITTNLQSVIITAANTNDEKVLAFNVADATGYDRARFEKDGAVFVAGVSQTARSDSSYATAATELKDTSRSERMDEQRLHLEFNDINGERKLLEITLRDVPDEFGRLSTYQIIEPAEGAIYDLYDPNGEPTTASGYQTQKLIPYENGLETRNETHNGVTYQQIMNVMTLALADNLPQGASFDDYNNALATAEKDVNITMDNIGRIIVKDLTTSESNMQISLFDADTDRFDDYALVSDKTALQSYWGIKGEQGWTLNDTRANKPLSEAFDLNFTGNLVMSGTDIYGNAVTATLNSDATLEEFMATLDNTFGDGVGNGGFVVDIMGDRVIVRDNTNLDSTPVQINLLFEDTQTDLAVSKSPNWTFASNNALTIDEPRVNLFDQLSEAIEAVRTGITRPDGNSEVETRNIGIQNAIYAVDHLIDHLNRVHTKNGSVSTALELTYEKSEMLTLNVNTLKSMVLDADIGEVVVGMNRAMLSYQAMLSTINKIAQLSLVNYL
jgi:flagellar hook-associated protein 3 FlgL